MASVRTLTLRDVEMLRLSWSILSRDKRMTGYKFMINLFTKFPESQKLFKKFKGQPLSNFYYNGFLTKANQALVIHGLMTVYVLESFVDNLDDLDMLDTLVRKLGVEHIPRNIRQKDFELVAPVMKNLLNDYMEGKPDLLPEMHSAWVKLIGAVVAIFADSQLGR